jgi:hypothetical protein
VAAPTANGARLSTPTAADSALTASAALTRVDQALAAAQLRDEDRAVLEGVRAAAADLLARAPQGGSEAALACTRLAILGDAVEALGRMQLALTAGRHVLDAGTLPVKKRSSLSALLRRGAAERDALLRLLAEAPLERADVLQAVRRAELRARSVQDAL